MAMNDSVLNPRHPEIPNGFTLVELMVALAVLAILLTIGIPGFQSVFAQNRATSSANQILASLQFARSEAIRLGEQVDLCPSTDGEGCTGGSDWSDGWVVLIDNEVRRVWPAFHSSVNATGADLLFYESAGQVDGQPVLANFSLSVQMAGGADRCVRLWASGKARIDSENCP